MLQTSGYMAAARSTALPRDIEYKVFSNVTGQLKRRASDAADFPALLQALTENVNLWRTIAFDVMDADNGLPKQLRAQLFYLFEFTQAHTTKVMRREAGVEPLIEINSAIMQGLKGNLSGEERP
ncbi:MAG: flagellar biosynthesis regulator FlaF [Pseudomonadota bacterium]